MPPRTPNQRAADALRSMRDARGNGATDAQQIAAGELAAGGDAEAARITAKVWGNRFLCTRAN